MLVFAFVSCWKLSYSLYSMLHNDDDGFTIYNVLCALFSQFREIADADVLYC